VGSVADGRLSLSLKLRFLISLVVNQCPTSTKIRIIDIDSAGPTAEGMTNPQKIMIIQSLISVNRNKVGYNKFLLAIAVVVVFVSYW